MPTWVTIHYRIITAISVEVIRLEISVCSEVFDLVGIKEPAPFGVIVSALKIVEARLCIVIVASVSERVSFCHHLLGTCNVRAKLYRAVAPCVVNIVTDLSVSRVVQRYNVALKILFEIVVIIRIFRIVAFTVFYTYR